MAQPLVSADWLAAHLGDPGIFVLDIRSVDGGGKAAYEQAHVPGAIHTDYVADGWRTTIGMASGMLPEPAFLARLLGGLGITVAHHVIVVSAGNSAGDLSAAARVVWTLKIVGHDAVSLLDGGMLAWQGRPTEAGYRARTPAPDYPVKLRPALRAELAEVVRAIADHSEVMLDSRSASYFEGREKSPQAKRGGRLPAAVQVEHTRCFDAANKRLLPVAELEKLFAGLPPLPVVNYCNTGQQAATTWFVLSEVLGRPNIKLYDGSMSQWTEDDSRPVEVG